MASGSSRPSDEKTKLSEDFHPSDSPLRAEQEDNDIKKDDIKKDDMEGVVLEEVDIDEAIERAGCGFGTLLYTIGTV